MSFDFLYSPWETLVTVAVSAVAIYVLMVVMLRVSGKRTLAKFNAFDFVVTVALGSMVANTILNEETTVAEGAVGIALLIGLQMAVSFTVTRWRGFQEAVKSKPRLLFYRGEFLRDALLAERVSTEEVRLAVRENGHARLKDLEAVVLETDGTISVIGRTEGGSLDALANVAGTETMDAGAGDRQPPAGRWDEHSRAARSVDASGANPS
jgi:uncharacterized membrane protein YcaP (DUF421 family)